MTQNHEFQSYEGGALLPVAELRIADITNAQMGVRQACLAMNVIAAFNPDGTPIVA